MSELVSALGAVSPLIAAIVVCTLLGIYVLEKLFGVNGPLTSLLRWLANRELNAQRRQAEAEEQERLRNDARVTDLARQVLYLEGELHEARKDLHEAREEARTAARNHEKATAMMRSELSAAREQLRSALRQLHDIRGAVVTDDPEPG